MTLDNVEHVDIRKHDINDASVLDQSGTYTTRMAVRV